MDSAIAELYAQVYAQPDDDHIKRVLSDALIAAGDPRGELILFQLEPDKDYHRRAMRLVQQHGMSWLGPLRDVAIPLAYERGFLASCLIVGDITPLLDAEEWATVHTFDLSELEHATPFDLPRTMRSLRKLVGVPAVRAAQLTAANASRAARLTIRLRGEPL